MLLELLLKRQVSHARSIDWRAKTEWVFFPIQDWLFD
jgi:hypothetical protein